MRAGEVKTGSFALEVPTEAELARRKRFKKGNDVRREEEPEVVRTDVETVEEKGGRPVEWAAADLGSPFS